jgi:hypothetical protein
MTARSRKKDRINKIEQDSRKDFDRRNMKDMKEEADLLCPQRGVDNARTKSSVRMRIFFGLAHVPPVENLLL